MCIKFNTVYKILSLLRKLTTIEIFRSRLCQIHFSTISIIRCRSYNYHMSYTIWILPYTNSGLTFICSGLCFFRCNFSPSYSLPLVSKQVAIPLASNSLAFVTLGYSLVPGIYITSEVFQLPLLL